MRILFVFLPVIFLTACSSTPYYQEPGIIDIMDSKVVVQWAPSNLPGNIFVSKNTVSL
jgi:hypothetical protein